MSKKLWEAIDAGDLSKIVSIVQQATEELRLSNARNDYLESSLALQEDWTKMTDDEFQRAVRCITKWHEEGKP